MTGTQRVMLNAAAAGATALVGLVIGVGAGNVFPAVIFTIAGLLALRFVPAATVYLTLILAFTTLPAVVPLSFEVADYSFRTYEPFIVLAAIYVWTRHRPQPYATACSVVLALVFLGAAAHGYLDGNLPDAILYELRPPLIMCLGIIVAAGVIDTPVGDRCRRLLPWILGVSAVVSLAGSVLGLEIAGRTEAATLGGVVGDATEASRLLTPATFLAVAALCAAAAALIARRATVRATLPYVAPSLVIVFLGFSRNHILGLAAACLFAVVAGRAVATLLPRLALAATVSAPFALVVVIGFSTLSPTSWAQQQVDAYFDRVVSGLTAETRSMDSSTQFRAEENRQLVAAFKDAPVLGHGLGHAYRPGVGPTGEFMRDEAPYYAHNFYLWLLVKAGALGLLGFAYATAGPLLSVFRDRRTIRLITGAAVCGFLAINFVAPMPNGAPTSLLMGALIGIAAGTSSRR